MKHFDHAGRVKRLWDMAYAHNTCIPLSRYNLSTTAEEVFFYDAAQDADRIKERINIFCEAYGKEVEENFLEMVVLRLEGLCKTIVRKACKGNPAFQ